MTPAEETGQEETFYCPYCSQIFKHKRSRDRHLKLVSFRTFFLQLLGLHHHKRNYLFSKCDARVFRLFCVLFYVIDSSLPTWFDSFLLIIIFSILFVRNLIWIIYSFLIFHQMISISMIDGISVHFARVHSADQITWRFIWRHMIVVNRFNVPHVIVAT